VPIERRCRHVGGPRRVDVVPRDGLMLAFLDGDQLPNSVGFAILPLRIASVCGSKTLSTLLGTCVSPPRSRARVYARTRVTKGCICRSRARTGQRRRHRASGYFMPMDWRHYR
jgi:hypothetical protein